jgi:zinc carboxypeptidase/immune inhibitor InhA-like protein
MSRRSLSAAVVALASLALAAPASAADLNAYRVKATAKNLRTLAQAGFDMTEGRRKDGTVEIVGTARQVGKLDVAATVVKDRAGRTAAQRSARLAPPADPVTYSGSDAEWTVWTRYDYVTDGKEQYREQYDRLDDLAIVKQETIGTTYLNRPIIALKVTKDAKTTADNTRPAVLYNALQHAREWLAGETCRRTLEYITSNYGTDETVTDLVDSTELWFVCVSNPDGYEYTFSEGNRLWRKNLADNNGDGRRGDLGDGVDPNRNFATNWGRDDEGSSPNPNSETYRGPSADSEPETQALKGLEARVDFVFQKNDHTAAELLLWPQGFQQYTPTPDNGIFEALAGNDAQPAIADFEDTDDDPDAEELHITGNRFDPDLSSELYITNGDALDDAYHNFGILGFTPEGTEADNPNVSGFEFADDEDAIEAEFQRHRRFAIDLALHAATPDDVFSFQGRTNRPFYIDSFPESWGDPQPVQVTALRSLGALKLRYRINGGAARTVSTKEWTGGERYGKDPGVYYHRVRGFVTGTRPGDRVQVWFEQASGGATSDSFVYRAVNESRDDVLIMAAEDYTGLQPNTTTDPTGPKYLSFYTKALDANRIDYDVYDVDHRNRKSPDWLGVLSHYKVVIWYTGDEYVTREPYQVPGTGSSRLSLDEQIDVRDFMNEGGKLFFTGQQAGAQYSDGFEVKNYGFRQAPDSMCSPTLPEFNEDDPGEADGCITHVDDFLQYYLGAYRYVAGGNSTDDAGNLLPVDGLAGGPFGGQSWLFDGTGAGNQTHSATFVVTSSVLDPAKYPLYADSQAVAGWRRPGAAPFNPFEGSYYMAAGADDGAYKRLRRTIDLTGKTSGELSFRTSFDLEPNYDYMFVEAHTVGQDNWTTLPAEETDLTSDSTGLSCFAGGDGSDWQSLHPFLTHYQHKTGPESCEPTGEAPFTGEWNAATGSSGGWVPWTVDLSEYAGQQVEVSITVATDPASLGLGVWVDQWSISADGAPVGSGGFEADDDGWTIGPPPDGTDNPENGWARAQESFKEGAVVATNDSIYSGFGFEGMNAKARPKFMGAAMRYLGIRAKPHSSPKPVASPPRAHAAKFMQRLLKASRKGRVKVRLGCTSDTACKGRLRLLRNGKTLGKKAFSIDAGKSKRLTVKLSKSAKRMLASKGSLRVRLSVQGADASGGSINASRRIRLAR